MKLTDAKLRNLTEPGKHFDGSGLYLDVTKAGGRYWRMKYRHGGKEKKLAFGVYPAVGLKDARDQAAEARKVLQAGDDPGAVRKASKALATHEAVNTFEAVARDWHQHQAARWESETAGASWHPWLLTSSPRWVPGPWPASSRARCGPPS